MPSRESITSMDLDGRSLTMEPRFQQRRDQLLADCQVPPATFRGAVSRLEAFARPFVAPLPSPESRQYTGTYLAGLLSDLEHKNAEAIAYRHALDRQTLQAFVGASPWDHTPPIDELNRQVAADLGRPDAVLVFDPSAFPKKGSASVGVQRQWCGRLGKVENCQVGVFLGYVTDSEHVLVDLRLYLPKEWAKDRKRRKRCGVPKEIRYCTRHELAWPGAAARLGQRRRRDGPSRVVPQEVGRSGRALLVGRAVEHDDPRPGGRAAAVRGPGPPPQAAVPGGARLVRVAAGGGVDPPDGPRRGEGPPGRGDRGAARGVEGGAEGGGVRGDAGGGTVRGGGQVEV